MHLPIIQARYYSISSSQDQTKNEVHLTVSLADHTTKGSRFTIHSNRMRHLTNTFVLFGNLRLRRRKRREATWTVQRILGFVEAESIDFVFRASSSFVPNAFQSPSTNHPYLCRKWYRSVPLVLDAASVRAQLRSPASQQDVLVLRLSSVQVGRVVRQRTARTA
jgi:hypothetical protein